MNEEALYDDAIGAHRDGRLEEAIQSYRAVLKNDPKHAGALHHLGLALHQRGEHAESEQLIHASLELAPNDGDAWANLGAVLRALKRRSEACEAFRRALAVDPGHPAAASNLGVVLSETGHSGDAVEVLQAVNEALPGRPPIQKHLGLSLMRLGRPQDAIPCLRDACQARPTDIELQSEYGVALMEVGDHAAAQEQFHRVLALNPNHSGAMVNLGEILTSRGDYDEAEKLLRRALEIDPNCAEARNNFGVLLSKLGEHDAATVALRRSLEINPLFVPAHHNLAKELLTNGEIVPAIEALHRAAKLDPLCVAAWYTLACTGNHTFSAAEIAHLEALLEIPEQTDTDRTLLHFALARALEITEPSLAFEHATKANGLRRTELEKLSQGYDPASHTVLVDGLIATFTPELFTRFSEAGNNSELPVFIVGMPRSGTSLVEQVLASHPDVYAAGELEEMARIAAAIPGYPTTIASCAQETMKSFSDAHIERLRAMGDEAIRVVDKMAVNFLHLGLIAILFPKARILHTRREPRDVALSCYFQNFASPAFAFASDLGHLAHFYREYTRLMEHWQKVLPNRFHEITYEDFVGTPEAQTRALIEYVDLPWDDLCLAPHATKRRVRTASVLQVREPIHTRSIARWHNFAEQLGSFPELPELSRPVG